MRKDAAATRQRILELAVTGAGPNAIAAEVGVTDRTVRHHLNDADTVVELRRLQDDRLRQLTRRAVDGADSALVVLRDLAEDTTQRGAVRVAAARAVIENAVRLAEATTVADRLDAIEAWIEAADEGDDGKQKRWQRWPG